MINLATLFAVATKSPDFLPWLPDGLFSYKKSPFGYILEGLGMENVGIFYYHLEYYTAMWWYTLRQLGFILCSLDLAFPFWYFQTNKNQATLLSAPRTN
jgi:hypothetical protein